LKTGLFFGSFNPVHIGHMIIGSYMAEFTDLDQVWFVVSPQNPLKPKKELLNEYERLEMIRLATEDDSKLKPSDIEFNLTRPSFTINTLLHLEEKFPDRQWVLIMGTDAFRSLPKWKNYDTLIENYEFYLYPRPGFDVEESKLPANIKLVGNVPFMQISASFVRDTIKKKKTYHYLLPENVYRYIDKWGFYQ
jgi:nicotinate-nucleotide adenylyltransferase